MPHSVFMRFIIVTPEMMAIPWVARQELQECIARTARWLFTARLLTMTRDGTPRSGGAMSTTW